MNQKLCDKVSVFFFRAVETSEMECKQYINFVFTFLDSGTFGVCVCVCLCVHLVRFGLSSSSCRCQCLRCFLFYSLSFLAACTVAPLAVCLYL